MTESVVDWYRRRTAETLWRNRMRNPTTRNARLQRWKLWQALQVLGKQLGGISNG